MSVGLITISLWIGMAAFGVVVALVNLRAARKDLQHQIGRPEPLWQRILIAKVNTANEIMRVVVLTLLLIAGSLVAAVQFTADPPPASLYVRSVILLTIATLVSQSLIHRWLRVRLTRRQPTNLTP